MLFIFLKGLLIGVAIAAPVGPIGVLCIQRSLHDGFKVGLMTGLGAALADGTYGLVAGFGLTAISSVLMEYQHWIRLFGGAFLLYLSAQLLSAAPTKATTGRYDASPWHALGTTYCLTLMNPSTILSFIAIFAGLGIGTSNPSTAEAITLVLGIIVGSAIWWLFLSGGIAFILHHKINTKGLRWINIGAGLIMLGFALATLKNSL